MMPSPISQVLAYYLSGALTVDTTSATGAFINGGNGFLGTAILGNTTAQSLNIITSNTTRISVSATGSTSITGGTSGVAFAVSNSTSTGNILVLNDDSTPVLTVADGGQQLLLQMVVQTELSL